MVCIDDYKEVKDCIYKDERYSARDNGAGITWGQERCALGSYHSRDCPSCALCCKDKDFYLDYKENRMKFQKDLRLLQIVTTSLGFLSQQGLSLLCT